MNELSEKQVCDVLTEMYGVNTSGLVRIEYIKLTGLELKGIVNACIKKYSASPNANTVLGDVRALKETIAAYKECFEKFIPSDKWDEATLFLSTYGSGLAKEIAKKDK